ncbi:MAG: phenylacetate--CoA ligase family protein [Dehalococcoidia bacterium]|nr:phenylacetate--CoA ligase family protein [Dehalococcoidia bacterium]
MQNTKLRALIKHAYENVPYYRRVFEERGWTDKDIQTVNDLPKLPILTKNDIRENFQDMLAKDYKKWKPIAGATGGSTGEPLKYYFTKDLASIGWAGMFRGWGWAGYRIGDKRISFGGSSLVPNKSPTLFEITRRKLERNLPLSAVSMNDAKYDKYMNTINSYKPKFIYGYPSSIYLLADYCKSHEINKIHFDAVFSTAEVLLPNYRTAIENQFQCEVFDQYGSYDGGGQALECQTHQGFHITIEKVILEIVDENGQKLPPGKSGRIIVTDLHNYAMPFVRYAVEDMGVLAEERCTCGRGLPLMKSIEGRTTDFIVLANGVVLSGPALTLVFKDCHIKQYQVVQEAEDKLLIKVMKGEGYTEQDTNHFLSIIKAHAGEGIEVEPEFVDEISATKAGKYRFIISRVSNLRGDQKG